MYLSNSLMGVAAVRGLHGGNMQGPTAYLAEGTIVSEAKHAAAYAFGGKDGMATDVSERTLHDVYLRYNMCSLKTSELIFTNNSVPMLRFCTDPGVITRMPVVGVP